MLITAATDHIPAGYPPDGLTFELIGSLNQVTWNPFLRLICGLIAESVPVFLSVRGAPGYTSGNIFLNDSLSGAIAMGDAKKIVEGLLAALESCVSLPRKKVEFS